MSADAKIMEALARIEHKLDVSLHLAAAGANFKAALKSLADVTHQCPLCKEPVTYNVDINDSVVVRKCGCKTGKIALDMKAFAPPVPIAKKKEEDNGGSDQEDRSDPDRGRRDRGR